MQISWKQGLAPSLLVILAACSTSGGNKPQDKAADVQAACFRDSCCSQQAALAFAPHRTRCEALAAEKTGLLKEADKGFAETIRQARAAQADNRRASAEVLCLGLLDAGRSSDNLGDVARATTLYSDATRECAATFGANSAEVFRARIAHADMLIDAGKLNEAGASLQNVLETSRQQDDKALRAAAVDAMGRLEDRRGDHTKARALLKQGLEFRQQVFGERSFEAAQSMIHLGDNAMLLRGWVDARGWYMRALDAIELGIGKRNRYYVNAKTALAAAFLRDRRYDALPSLYEDLLALSKEVFGPQSEEYAGTLNDAAALQYMQRQYPAAYEKFRVAAEIRRQTMPGSLLLGWTDLNAAKARLEVAHCGTVRPLLLEAQEILGQQKSRATPDPELPDYSAEFSRVAQLCTARPEPAAAPVKPATKPRKKR